MIVVLNGALGIGKSTLAEALSEEWEYSVMLDGDHLIALTPEPDDPLRYLHRVVCVLIEIHLESGYRNFVLNHIWRTQSELDDLIAQIKKVDSSQDVRSFLLVLAERENLRRVSNRQAARAIDESEYELETLHEEREVLYGSSSMAPGELFDVSASPDDLVAQIKTRLGIEERN